VIVLISTQMAEEPPAVLFSSGVTSTQAAHFARIRGPRSRTCSAAGQTIGVDEDHLRKPSGRTASRNEESDGRERPLPLVRGSVRHGSPFAKFARQVNICPLRALAQVLVGFRFWIYVSPVEISFGSGRKATSCGVTRPPPAPSSRLIAFGAGAAEAV